MLSCFLSFLFCKRDQRLIKWPPVVAVVFLRCSTAAGRLSERTALFCNVFCRRHDPAWPFEGENTKTKQKKKELLPVLFQWLLMVLLIPDAPLILSFTFLMWQLKQGWSPPRPAGVLFSNLSQQFKGTERTKKFRLLIRFKTNYFRGIKTSGSNMRSCRIGFFFKTSGNDSDKRLKDNPHWVVKRFQHSEMTAWRRDRSLKFDTIFAFCRTK